MIYVQKTVLFIYLYFLYITAKNDFVLIIEMTIWDIIEKVCGVELTILQFKTTETERI